MSEELTVDLVNRELNEEMAGGLVRSLEEFVSKNGEMSSWELPVFRAGHWLGERMKREGATDEEVEAICERLGMESRKMVGRVDVYLLAIEFLKRWRIDRSDSRLRNWIEISN